MPQRNENKHSYVTMSLKPPSYVYSLHGKTKALAAAAFVAGNNSSVRGPGFDYSKLVSRDHDHLALSHEKKPVRSVPGAGAGEGWLLLICLLYCLPSAVSNKRAGQQSADLAERYSIDKAWADPLQ